MTDTIDGLSMNTEQTNIDKLKAIFPECFAEGKLDIDKLLSLCGEYIDNDFEKYKFEWKGKAECLKLVQKRSSGTLRPCVEESVNFDTTQNLYIEGDNLEVLKLLQTAYSREVKMIYIDPPYNTGNDFVYEDDFADPMARYKEVTRQTTKSNPETMGRYHTKWLNMIYPRLRLAANLLRDDGVIFISIDDNEVANLRKVCDEVFGEENLIAQICHKARASISNDKIISSNHNYILLYAKNYNEIFNIRNAIGLDPNLEGFNQKDEKGYYKLMPVDGPGGAKKGNPFYSFLGVEGYWRFSKETMQEKYDQGLIVKSENSIQQKYYLDQAKNSRQTDTTWWDEDVLTSNATKDFIKLMGGKYFDNPKNVNLLIRMLKSYTHYDKDAIILDFFAGSSTTAHAVMQLNAEDGCNRRFICVQLPEMCDEKSEAYTAGYKNICEIGKERIRRAGKQLCENAECRNTVDEISAALDIGFKVFKLDTSNLKTWDGTPVAEDDMQILLDRMNGMVHRVKYDRTDMDMVYEIMLKSGVPLTRSVGKIEVNGKTVYAVDDIRPLLICLVDDVQPEDVEAMAEYAPAKLIIARDSFKNDSAMANAHYVLRDRGIELKLI